MEHVKGTIDLVTAVKSMTAELAKTARDHFERLLRAARHVVAT